MDWVEEAQDSTHRRGF